MIETLSWWRGLHISVNLRSITVPVGPHPMNRCEERGQRAILNTSMKSIKKSNCTLPRLGLSGPKLGARLQDGTLRWASGDQATHLTHSDSANNEQWWWGAIQWAYHLQDEGWRWGPMPVGWQAWDVFCFIETCTHGSTKKWNNCCSYLSPVNLITCPANI